MKQRTDHVTNSSSSSFVVMGAYIKFSDIPPEKFDVIREKVNDPNLTNEEILQEMMEYFDYFTVGSKLTSSTCGDYYYADGISVGIRYTDMHENETLAQFKERVKSHLKSCLGMDVDVNHIEAGWMDG